MNIVKFDDTNMTPDIINELPSDHPLRLYILNIQHDNGDDDSDIMEEYVEWFCNLFNESYRNKYAYAVNWGYILPLTADIGNPFNDEDSDDQRNYIMYSRNESLCENDKLIPFDALVDWMDKSKTLSVMYDEHTKYSYLNEFTPDNDITIEELKRFRTWLAEILLRNEPLIQDWPTEDLLRSMLTYYAQNMADNTVKLLNDFTPYMNLRSLVTGISQTTLMGLSNISLQSGCGCTGNRGVNISTGASGATCDPLTIYRTAMYNYMVDTFSNIGYWMEQVEICEEMIKYIEGILKVGLPLTSNIVDPYADCTCNSLDSDMAIRYRKMLENLLQALNYIVNDEVSGNRNFVSTAFNDWATYLYEHMYWA